VSPPCRAAPTRMSKSAGCRPLHRDHVTVRELEQVERRTEAEAGDGAAAPLPAIVRPPVTVKQLSGAGPTGTSLSAAPRPGLPVAEVRRHTSQSDGETGASLP
jgi:hypothetical protein